MKKGVFKAWLSMWSILALLLHPIPSNGSGCSNANFSRNDSQWIQFKLTYKKNYSKNEDCQRRSVWESNFHIIEEHNAAADKGKHTYWMGMNEHGDRTNDEIKNMYLGGYDPSFSLSSTFRLHNEPRLDHPGSTPRLVDWRDRGCNISADDQQPCGSCYIFASLAALECQHTIKSAAEKKAREKIAQRLSVQQVIDCANRESFLIRGCYGGMPNDVYLFEIEQQGNGIFHGFVANSCYPYTGIDHGENCSRDLVQKCEHRVHVKKIHDLKLKEAGIQKRIHDNGPAVVSMTVLVSKFRWYKHGVYSDSLCSFYSMNHAVALWGYGGGDINSNEPRYWLIKNSFGSSWGDNGFAKMSRDNSINCNLENYFVQPEV